ncbi:class I SAM-dependent methyltransferase [Staphylococcus agnetis]|uniref:class I SAM-dependent methyltransferase n=1 Tax=Staphylococcus agnetis TaxID=985762 RepID=UPI000CD0A832|nr:class I SAM-dependent methyltransferase [Staphylococcus agnetis]MBY7665561.1 class I SAM-dependent methyltransferase [Staphylococcus agnetis]NJH67322.1 methyltransferase [Staphylococcus agnetis]NJH78698.1 methyltransferase [Staphylococcus agnetis]PNY87203.1 class I SAM-dependent methyltransferase [Staphylococcus agnetis]PTH67151.1 class I SAM-dependent methyltransferase [Staphylococcus agnetis]
MSHYYDSHPDSETNEQTITYDTGHHQLTLTTDAGVFSRDRVDFGSDLLIRTFLNAHPPGEVKHIIDVGCGYGPIGLMLAKVAPHDQITMLDVNHRALSLVEKNAKHNDIRNVTVQESDGLSVIAANQADYILTNPPIRAGKQVVHQILEDAFQCLKPEGALYVVIQKKQGMPSAKKKMEAVFGNVASIKNSKGYHILKSIKG